jgi:2-polyprenyl-6-hydroxyphenyl methylase/3-demethylubiquinone-9 3-methyltransferase
MATWEAERDRGERFEFGANWQRFLSCVDDQRLAAAADSLRRLLAVDSLAGRSLLDAGCGSGLSSLVARRLGARVCSFDYDPQSVACTMELRRRFQPDDPDWTVLPGSVLDQDFLAGLGRFDVVYSWGVLHHTGAMWQAIANVADLVGPGGLLALAIYNDQGLASAVWRRLKACYNRSGALLRWVILLATVAWFESRTAVKNVLTLHNPWPVRRWREYFRQRGMSQWHDYVDWAGGYPFEVAKPEELRDFLRPRGFELVGLETTSGLGCNQFLFQRRPQRQPEAS